MRSAYKWRLNSSEIAYLTDKEGGNAFISTGISVDDAAIATKVNSFSESEYKNNFNNSLKPLVEGKGKKLLTYDHYYNLGDDSCIVSVGNQIQGEKGDKGDIGPVGATGPVGPQGLMGLTGSPGSTGLNGYTTCTFYLYKGSDVILETVNLPEERGKETAKWNISGNTLVPIPNGWYTTEREITQRHIYRSSAVFRSDTCKNTSGWSNPIRITGSDGRDGVDADNVEYIYKLVKDEEEAAGVRIPEATKKGKVPVGWTDNPSGISKENRVEMMCFRNVENFDDETPIEWNEPQIWSRWGKDGTDGAGVEYIYCTSNEMKEDGGIPDKYKIPNINYLRYTLGKEYAAQLLEKAIDFYPNSSWFTETNIEWIKNNIHSPYVSSDYECLMLDNNHTSGVEWKDNPQEIKTDVRYEWVSKRRYNGSKAIWTDFTTPQLWATYAVGSTIFESFVFTKTKLDLSNNVTVSGGTYSSPIPTETYSGTTKLEDVVWTDSTPEGNDILWMTHSQFSSSNPSVFEWSTPQKMSDTASFNSEFLKTSEHTDLTDVEINTLKSEDYNFGKISGSTEEEKETNFRNKVKGLLGTKLIAIGDNISDATYMLTATCANNEWKNWTVTRVKGEKGETGTSITTKGSINGVVKFGNLPSASEKVNQIWLELYSGYTGTIEKWYESDSYNKLYKSVNNTWVEMKTGDSFGTKNGDGYLYDGYIVLCVGNTWSVGGKFQGDPGKNAYMHIKYAVKSVREDPEGLNKEHAWLPVYGELGNESGLTHIEYTKDESAIPTKSLGELPGRYIGQVANNEENDPDFITGYTWSLHKGDDACGYEYAYCLTNNSTIAPTCQGLSSENVSEYLPNTDSDWNINSGCSMYRSGTTGPFWFDDQVLPNKDFKYAWRIWRKQSIENDITVWGDWKGSASGDDAIMVNSFGYLEGRQLRANTATIVRHANNTTEPSYITPECYFNNEKVNNALIYYSIDGDTAVKLTGAIIPTANIISKLDIWWAKSETNPTTEYYDYEEIPVTNDGSQGIVMNLTSDTAFIECNSYGHVEEEHRVETTVQLFEGTNDLLHSGGVFTTDNFTLSYEVVEKSFTGTIEVKFEEDKMIVFGFDTGTTFGPDGKLFVKVIATGKTGTKYQGNNFHKVYTIVGNWKGSDGFVCDLSNQMDSIVTEDGKIVWPDTALTIVTIIRLWKGNEPISITGSTIDISTSFDYATGYTSSPDEIITNEDGPYVWLAIRPINGAPFSASETINIIAEGYAVGETIIKTTSFAILVSPFDSSYQLAPTVSKIGLLTENGTKYLFPETLNCKILKRLKGTESYVDDAKWTAGGEREGFFSVYSKAVDTSGEFVAEHTFVYDTVKKVVSPWTISGYTNAVSFSMKLCYTLNGETSILDTETLPVLEGGQGPAGIPQTYIDLTNDSDNITANDGYTISDDRLETIVRAFSGTQQLILNSSQISWSPKGKEAGDSKETTLYKITTSGLTSAEKSLYGEGGIKLVIETFAGEKIEGTQNLKITVTGITVDGVTIDAKTINFLIVPTLRDTHYNIVPNVGNILRRGNSYEPNVFKITKLTHRVNGVTSDVIDNWSGMTVSATTDISTVRKVFTGTTDVWAISSPTFDNVNHIYLSLYSGTTLLDGPENIEILNNGVDGNGYEYIYCKTSGDPTTYTPTFSGLTCNNEDEYLPNTADDWDINSSCGMYRSGTTGPFWFDDELKPDETYKYVWQLWRRKEKQDDGTQKWCSSWKGVYDTTNAKLINSLGYLETYQMKLNSGTITKKNDGSRVPAKITPTFYLNNSKLENQYLVYQIDSGGYNFKSGTTIEIPTSGISQELKMWWVKEEPKSPISEPTVFYDCETVPVLLEGSNGISMNLTSDVGNANCGNNGIVKKEAELKTNVELFIGTSLITLDGNFVISAIPVEGSYSGGTISTSVSGDKVTINVSTGVTFGNDGSASVKITAEGETGSTYEGVTLIKTYKVIGNIEGTPGRGGQIYCDLSNEMESVPVINGKINWPDTSITIDTDVRMWNGTDEVNVTKIDTDEYDDIFEISSGKTSGHKEGYISITPIDGAVLSEQVCINITSYGTIEGETVSKECKFTVRVSPFDSVFQILPSVNQVVKVKNGTTTTVTPSTLGVEITEKINGNTTTLSSWSPKIQGRNDSFKVHATPSIGDGWDYVYTEKTHSISSLTGATNIVLELRYYSGSTTEYEVIDRETIPFVADGEKGTDGKSQIYCKLDNAGTGVSVIDGKVAAAKTGVTYLSAWSGDTQIPFTTTTGITITPTKDYISFSGLTVENYKIKCNFVIQSGKTGPTEPEYFTFKCNNIDTNPTCNFTVTPTTNRNTYDIYVSNNKVDVNPNTSTIAPNSLIFDVIKYAPDGSTSSTWDSGITMNIYKDGEEYYTDISEKTTINLLYKDFSGVTCLTAKLYSGGTEIDTPETVLFTKSGVNGEPGQKGDSAVYADLTLESASIPCDENNKVLSSGVTPEIGCFMKEGTSGLTINSIAKYGIWPTELSIVDSGTSSTTPKFKIEYTSDLTISQNISLPIEIKSGSKTCYKTFTISRNPYGYSLYLQPSTNAISETSGGTASPSQMRFDIVKQNNGEPTILSEWGNYRIQVYNSSGGTWGNPIASSGTSIAVPGHQSSLDNWRDYYPLTCKLFSDTGCTKLLLQETIYLIPCGKPGVGFDGCIIRRSEWDDTKDNEGKYVTKYRNDSLTTPSEQGTLRYIDYVSITNGTTAQWWLWNNSISGNTDPRDDDGTHWKEITEVEPFRTSFADITSAVTKYIQSDQLVLMKKKFTPNKVNVNGYLFKPVNYTPSPTSALSDITLSGGKYPLKTLYNVSGITTDLTEDVSGNYSIAVFSSLDYGVSESIRLLPPYTGSEDERIEVVHNVDEFVIPVTKGTYYFNNKEAKYEVFNLSYHRIDKKERISTNNNFNRIGYYFVEKLVDGKNRFGNTVRFRELSSLTETKYYNCNNKPIIAEKKVDYIWTTQNNIRKYYMLNNTFVTSYVTSEDSINSDFVIKDYHPSKKPFVQVFYCQTDVEFEAFYNNATISGGNYNNPKPDVHEYYNEEKEEYEEIDIYKTRPTVSSGKRIYVIRHNFYSGETVDDWGLYEDEGEFYQEEYDKVPYWIELNHLELTTGTSNCVGYVPIEGLITDNSNKVSLGAGYNLSSSFFTQNLRFNTISGQTITAYSTVYYTPYSDEINEIVNILPTASEELLGKLYMKIDSSVIPQEWWYKSPTGNKLYQCQSYIEDEETKYEWVELSPEECKGEIYKISGLTNCPNVICNGESWDVNELYHIPITVRGLDSQLFKTSSGDNYYAFYLKKTDENNNTLVCCKKDDGDAPYGVFGVPADENPNPLWFGGEASTPTFSVSQTGKLTANNAVVKGEIYANSGSFTGTVNATSGSFNGDVSAKSLSVINKNSDPTFSFTTWGEYKDDYTLPDTMTDLTLTDNSPILVLNDWSKVDEKTQTPPKKTIVPLLALNYNSPENWSYMLNIREYKYSQYLPIFTSGGYTQSGNTSIYAAKNAVLKKGTVKKECFYNYDCFFIDNNSSNYDITSGISGDDAYFKTLSGVTITGNTFSPNSGTTANGYYISLLNQSSMFYSLPTEQGSLPSVSFLEGFSQNIFLNGYHYKAWTAEKYSEDGARQNANNFLLSVYEKNNANNKAHYVILKNNNGGQSLVNYMRNMSEVIYTNNSNVFKDFISGITELSNVIIEETNYNTDGDSVAAFLNLIYAIIEDSAYAHTDTEGNRLIKIKYQVKEEIDDSGNEVSYIVDCTPDDDNWSYYQTKLKIVYENPSMSTGDDDSGDEEITVIDPSQQIIDNPTIGDDIVTG